MTGIILILSPLILAIAIPLDIYAPSIPEIREYFGVNQSVMQLTVSLFELITGVGQLVVGPLSDQIGRRKVVLASIFLLFLGSMICAFSFDMSWFIFGRVIQAMGSCGMMVTCFAIVRDLFSEKECGHVYSFLNSTISLSPLLVPVVGGYLAYFFNWRATFIFLGIIAVAIFVLAKKDINETLDPKNQRTLRKEFFLDYLQLFRNSQFCAYAFCSSAGLACFLTFFSSASYIIITLLKTPEQHFGFYFATIGISFFLSSLFCGHITKFLGAFRTVLIGGFLIFLSGLTMFFWYYHFGLSISGFMWPMMLMSLGGAFVMGAGAGGAISPFPEMAGTASALFGCLQFVFAFVVSQIVLHWKVKSTLPLSYTLIALGIASVLVMLLSYRKLKSAH